MLAAGVEGSSSSPPPASEYVALYDRCGTNVLIFLTRRVFDVEVARDLWAETFAIALEQWGTRRGRTQSETEAWVFGIARRVLARYYRRGYAETRALHRMGLERPELPVEDAERLSRLAELAELKAVLAAALSALSPHDREAVTLRVIDGLTYPAVASRLGISEASARQRVSRALRRLRRSLQTNDPGTVTP